MKSDAAVAAALSICESLLISLRERGVLSADEVKGLLADAASAHHHMGIELAGHEDAEFHKQAAGLIERIRNHVDSVRD